MPRLIDRVARFAATSAHSLLKASWFLRRPRTYGAHAIALTPEGRLVLVRLRYAPGWRLPGGGRAADEDRQDAALRELREEIGLVSHGPVRLACELEESADFKRDTAALVIVEGVEYRPKRWNWEIEEVGEFALDALPEDLSPRAGGWIEAVRPFL